MLLYLGVLHRISLALVTSLPFLRFLSPLLAVYSQLSIVDSPLLVSLCFYSLFRFLFPFSYLNYFLVYSYILTRTLFLRLFSVLWLLLFPFFHRSLSFVLLTFYILGCIFPFLFFLTMVLFYFNLFLFFVARSLVNATFKIDVFLPPSQRNILWITRRTYYFKELPCLLL